MGRKHVGRIWPTSPNTLPIVFAEDRRPDLGVPNDLELLALGVVGNAGKLQGLEVSIAH